MIFGREPALILGAIRAVVVLGTAFGLKLTVEQTAAVYAVCEVVLQLAVRQAVTPVADPRL